MAILQVVVLVLVKQDFFLELKGLYMVSKVIEVNGRGLRFLKLNALNSDLGVLRLAFLKLVILLFHLVNAALLLRFVLLDHNDVLQTEVLLVI